MARLRKVHRLIKQLRFRLHVNVRALLVCERERESSHIAKELAGAFPLDADSAVSQPRAVPIEDELGRALLREALDVAVRESAPARAIGGLSEKASAASKF